MRPRTTSRSPSGAAVRLHRGRLGRRRDDRPLGQQVPRALACLRMRRVLVVDGQLVADPAVGDQLAARDDLDQRAHPAAARRVDPQTVVLVGDLVAAERFPVSTILARQ